MARPAKVTKGLRKHPRNAKEAKAVYDANFSDDEDPDINTPRSEPLPEGQSFHPNFAHQPEPSPDDSTEDLEESLAGDADASTEDASEPPSNERGHPSSVPDDCVPQLQNFTSTVNLTCQIDLKTLNQTARNTEYNPKRFAAVIMRIRAPRTTALVFANGKMIITGCKNELDSKLGARKCAAIIQKCGFSPKFVDFKIRNVVGTADTKFVVDIEKLAQRHANYCSYEPEIFPGLVYRMISLGVVMMIFVSGKVVITGAKSREGIYVAFQVMYPVLMSVRGGDGVGGFHRKRARAEALPERPIARMLAGGPSVQGSSAQGSSSGQGAS